MFVCLTLNCNYFFRRTISHVKPVTHARSPKKTKQQPVVTEALAKTYIGDGMVF